MYHQGFLDTWCKAKDGTLANEVTQFFGGG